MDYHHLERAFRFLLLAAALIVYAGCEVDRVIVINNDGSGRIEEKFLMPRDALIPTEKPKPGELVPLPPDIGGLNVAKNGENLGEGVTLIAYKKLETKDAIGYEATFEFKDITKLRPKAVLNSAGIINPQPEDATETEQHFEFSKGELSEITIPMRHRADPLEDAKAQAPQAQTPEQEKQNANAAVEIMKRARSKVVIRPGHSIVETNAHFHTDREVTVSEENFKGMAADPQYAELVKKAESGDELRKETEKEEKYFKGEPATTVRIKFR